MNAALPTGLAQALAPMAPPQSMVHQIVRDADLAYNALKNSGELERRRNAKALRLQIERPLFGVAA